MYALQDDFVYIVSDGARTGEELTIDYGGKHNATLIQQFGFVLEGNIDDEIVLGEPDAGRISEQRVDKTLALAETEESQRSGAAIVFS